ncbi:integrator complex subunit [Nesidiocoris tenuis]|uniref:Integrator complex subunit n=1 Tax=Nesidiocoris tenuis TaxID=355587 RepID=A0ABN7AXF6_9HEMI|nr:integrator complex subunit [Nesidiocoris tenuis]
MSVNLTVPPPVFKCLRTLDIGMLMAFSTQELRPVLPCLVRMSLISPIDTTKTCSENRKDILKVLSGIEMVNSIVALLSIDFHALEIEVKKEQQLRQKAGSAHSDGLLVQSVQNGLAMEFERSDPTRRLRLVLSEILFISSQIQEDQQQQRSVLDTFVKHSDLFENIVYIPEICDVLSIALSELPFLLSPVEIVETLLHMKYGPDIICWIVANSPDSYWDVCKALVANSDKLEDENNGGKIRIQALMKLCRMWPEAALSIRTKCVELCKMPALAINLSLEGNGIGDIVSFTSGLLLGTDQQIRNWFSSFIRNRQKRNRDVASSLQSFRDELLIYLNAIVNKCEDNKLPEGHVVQASSLLRLYCALRGIAGIKLQEDEISSLVNLVTSHPPPSATGVRFVSLGLCMLIACPSLTGNHEATCIQWVKWLAGEEAYLESGSGVTSSFGEMLLLMAIHFHSNQLSAICELVCSTLGMKVPIRHNTMTRMKHVFTQEIFTEQVVTSHAVKVPVTPNLNANVPGFLPVHCIHQLLKSRLFTKYKVPIKDWIYRQICVSVPPLHPVLPALVEVYVNSILHPAGKGPQENTNQPMSEDEIRAIFSTLLISCSSREGGKLAKVEKSSLTSQLLMLYYLLHYEDVRLSTSATNRKVKAYSQEFLAELPIKYLLQQAQRDQASYGGIFSSLLRLLATHFPHLCLVDDWMERQSHSIGMLYNVGNRSKNLELTAENISHGLGLMTSRPSHTGRLLGSMLETPPAKLWKFAPIIIKHFRQALEPTVPRYIQELYKQVWLRLNSVLPRCLWVMTTNALLPDNPTLPAPELTQENVILDPLQVLRCDPRIFRCAPLLSVVLRVLQSCLAASQSQLSRHLLDNPIQEKSIANCTDSDREELRSALVSAQESLAVQILLEACLESSEDQEKRGNKWALREVRSVVCSYFHQLFIAEPSLAKLIHFQGYMRDLLPVTIAGVPSLHICLDFIPELLSQPVLEKQIFAVDLVSRLALQYSLPKAMSVTRLAINTLSTLLAVLPRAARIELFSSTLDCFVRICEAFPPLIDDVLSLLLQLGRVCKSEDSLAGSWSWPNPTSDTMLGKRYSAICDTSATLAYHIELTFDRIMNNALLDRLAY